MSESLSSECESSIESFNRTIQRLSKGDDKMEKIKKTLLDMLG
jgi:hypothetical protein